MDMDKKKLAMLIIGNKEDKSEQNDDHVDYGDKDMGKDAEHYAAKGLIKAVKSDDPDKLLKSLKKLLAVLEDEDDMDDDEGNKEDY